MGVAVKIDLYFCLLSVCLYACNGRESLNGLPSNLVYNNHEQLSILYHLVKIG